MLFGWGLIEREPDLQWEWFDQPLWEKVAKGHNDPYIIAWQVMGQRPLVTGQIVLLAVIPYRWEISCFPTSLYELLSKFFKMIENIPLGQFIIYRFQRHGFVNIDCLHKIFICAFPILVTMETFGEILWVSEGLYRTAQ